MEQSVFIFIGHSGAGKGTQVSLLESTLTSTDPQTPIFHLETGKKFRELMASDTYTGKKTKALLESGTLAPSFLAVHAWSHELIYCYDGSGHVFIDGMPRVVDEVQALLSAIKFYGWKPHIIYLEVSDAWAFERLSNRGRDDDKEDEIKKRIAWFHQSVMPAIDMLRQSPLVSFHTIHGEQSIEAVHQEIIRSLGL
jgi:adenylate kinase